MAGEKVVMFDDHRKRKVNKESWSSGMKEMMREHTKTGEMVVLYT